MDLQFLFQILWKRKWLLVVTSIVAAGLAFFLVSLLPPTFNAKALIGTGIINKKGIDLERENPFLQQYQVNSQFSNLIKRLESRTNVRYLTYHLLMHDLQALQTNAPAFRQPEEEELAPFRPQLPALLNKLKTHQDSLSYYGMLSQAEEERLKEVAEIYHYDYESLSEHMTVRRLEDTDYIQVEFKSENPVLSAFAANTLSREFIRYYKTERIQEENSTIAFYGQLVENKKREIDNLIAQESNYKQNNEIVNLDEQSLAIISQIKELEVALEEEKKNIEGYRQAIARLGKDIEQEDSIRFAEYANSLLLREEFSGLREERLAMLDEFTAKGGTPGNIDTQIRGKNDEISRQVSELADDFIRNTEDEDVTEQILLKRIDNEVNLLLAQESVASYQRAIDRLRREANSFVSDEAFLTSVATQKEILAEEYLELVNKYNEAQRLAMLSTTPLQIIEEAEVPDDPESSKAIFIAAFAAFAMLMMVAVILVFLGLLDNRPHSADRLQRLTNLPVLGTVPALKKANSLQSIFENPAVDKNGPAFLESLRRIRHEIANSGAKQFLFTSPKEEEGKSFLIIALAQTLSRMQRRVLVIDTNLKHNTLTALANKTLDNNPLHNGVRQEITASEEISAVTNVQLAANVDILGNRGGGYSPAELLSDNEFNTLLEEFSQQYDYIFMEAAALNAYSDTQEMLDYAEKIIAIFGADQPITDTDKASITFLQQQNGKLLGTILNNVTLQNH